MTSIINNGSIKSSSCKDVGLDGRRTIGSPYVNPFVHKLELVEPIDIIKTYVFTVILLPIRVICICIFLIIAWLLTCLGLYGLSPEDLKTRPITGWRKTIKDLTALAMRALFAVGSFTYIKYKGTQASPKEAPILCVAPHSSYIDSIVVVVMGPPSIVAKAETSQLPIFGKLINFSQPIYVLREDPNSRQNTIKEIIERANSKEDWPQVVIFPEGTCTNRSALITFKPGAFYPGVPIQPVLLRYPNKLDTFTWTWEGPGALKLLWLTLTQIHSACEIEFLPVYKPSPEEKANPKLYARNVRDYMAKALDVPTSEFSYDDCVIMTTAKDMNIPHAPDIVEIERLRKLLKSQGAKSEETILSEYTGSDEFITLRDFSGKLQQSPDDAITRQLFYVLDENNSGKISLRNYLLCGLFLIKQEEPIIDFLTCAAKIYDCSKRKISRSEFYSILRHTGRISKEKSELIYTEIARKNGNCVMFSDFINYVHQNPEYTYLLASDEKLKKH